MAEVGLARPATRRLMLIPIIGAQAIIALLAFFVMQRKKVSH